MIPSRYMLIDERSPYPMKRRVRGRRDEREGEPAITLLPPDPYMIMERPNFVRPSSPTIYRTAPPKSAKNKQASSFVILGETLKTPVQSRPASPSGRVSPFRGHGFKSPSTTRSNSRATSPARSPKKVLPKPKPVKVSERPRISKDIGLPPKSPIKVTSQKSKQGEGTQKTETTEIKLEEDTKPPENDELKLDKGDSAVPEEQITKELEEIQTTEEQMKVSDPEQETAPSSEQKNKPSDLEQQSEPSELEQEINPSDLEQQSKPSEIEQQSKPSELEQQSKPSKSDHQTKPSELLTQKPPQAPKSKQRLTPVAPHDKKLPKTPSPRPKTKFEKNEAHNQQSAIKKAVKPPIPPKKIALKTTLKTDDKTNRNTRDAKPSGKENLQKKEPMEVEKPKETAETKEAQTKENLVIDSPNESEKSKVEDEGVKEDERKPVEGEKAKTEEKGEEKEENPGKLIPCFQPDKCQIAPPTMASPSPIITPTISTSTTADLASSSVKNSQSIATAPTTVTPSSLSSVSSTVVLTGNLARKEIERIKSRAADSEKAEGGAVLAEESEDPTPRDKVPSQMVKAATKDSLKWSNKDNLSGEVLSTTKVIKAEPDMEVLSPNNLRDSPPRMPPPNLAWDEGRLANGDVPNKAKTEGKIRRFASAVWKFLSYLFCCRWFNSPKCCRKPIRDAVGKPSLFSKLNCCKGKPCRNPFTCCTGCCKSKCCEGKKCCRRKPKPGNPKAKPRRCCAKVNCSCKGCCDNIKACCLDSRHKLNTVCRSLFCLNMICCQNFLRKFRCCHKFKCCQKNGICSCCNPNVKREAKKLNKKGSRASNNSRDKDNLDVVLVEHTSLMKAAIPVLPTCLAVFCLILNLFLPGFGTFVSGILCLCFGKPRFSVKDTPKSRVGSFIVNTIIGVAQLFTVVFCLVGWGWSIWWGVIMYKLSRRQKRLKLAEKNQKEAEGSNVNHNHVDVEQG